ncbi:TlpA family protein disulfide reductase [Corynebacterium choanae]|uniref:Sporulation thiol-disulfide oxidoreductase A n=1 Tax=Corynebacterium choanae TaxID=1862358 RepID=A0A3G6J9H1_9CORY|nr:TlpA disulfide reductase family protein [Corynebacterium choanae]AZA14559.1 Sporulation thiol-disulfide oxidoreductase A precursor [Corynebacterium choanae]
MNTTVRASIIGMALVAAILVTVTFTKLTSNEPAEDLTAQPAASAVAAAPTTTPADTGEDSSTTAFTERANPFRPDFPECPVTTIAGIQFPCLGHPDKTAKLPIQQPTVVAVWAYWCKPCVKELPLLAEFAANHPEYQVIGMHADQTPQAGADLLDELGVRLPSLLDSRGDLAKAVGLPNVIPLLVVFDANGNKVATLTLSPNSADDIATAVAGALQG